MSADNNNHAPVPVEDLQDRLMDSALAELLAGRVPPDLSARILKAHDAILSTNPSSTSTIGGRWSRIKWISVAIAATLLVSAITWLNVAPQDSPVAIRTEIGEMQSGSKAAIREEFVRQEEGRKRQDFESNLTLLQSTADKTVLTTDGAAGGPGAGISPPIVEDIAASTPAKATSSNSLSIDAAPMAGPESGELALPTFAPIAHNSQLGDAPAPQAPTTEVHNESFDQADFKFSKSQSGRGAAAAKKLSLGIDANGRYGMPSQPSAPAVADGLYAYNDVPSLGVEFSAGSPAAPQPSKSKGSTSPTIAPQQQLGRANNGKLDLYALSDLKKLGERAKELPQRLPSDDAIGLTGLVESGDKYTPINENAFIKAIGPDAVSTFSIDVDTASYSNVRQFLMESHQLPPANAVRIEELVNYFQYDYTPPKNDDEAPFAALVEVAGCPWNSDHRLARIAVKGREMERSKRPLSNLVFLVDVSGSMNEPAKLPLVVYGLEQLTRELGENDHIAIVVYAGTEGLALPSTSGSKQDMILATLGKLQAGGSTAGGAGISLAYQIAEDNFIKGGTNRVILCTDGDFNVGVTDTGELQKLVEKKAKDTGVFLSVLGFGRGNLNDAMMEAVSNHGNGNYHYVDNRTEARRVLVEEMTGTLVTIAKDVKIQVEFNPSQVAAYRLIGYEDRMLKTEDFNDDKKDAGEIGAGHNVTALYEVVPAGKTIDSPKVDELKYQKPVGRTILSDQSAKEVEASKGTDKIVRPIDDASKELLTLKMRYKAPDGDTSKKLEWAITDGGKSYGEATDDFQFASAVAGFGLLLRDSQYKGNLTFAAVLELGQSGLGTDERGYRKEFLELVKEAKKLKSE